MSNYGVFLVRVLPHSDSANAGKCGPEKTPYLDTFYAVKSFRYDRKHYANVNSDSNRLCRMFIT